MKNRHLWIMLLCALPLVGFIAAWFLGVQLGTLGTTALILLCPVSHVVMMLFMRKKHQGKSDSFNFDS